MTTKKEASPLLLATLHDVNSIKEEEAVRLKGYMVELPSSPDGTCDYVVRRLPSHDLPSSIRRLIVSATLYALVISCVGALFMRYYTLPSIGKYMDYDVANCTVLSYQLDTDSKSRSYNVHVTYTDSNGEMHNRTISDVSTLKWGVGDKFECSYKGNFIEPYDEIVHAYHLASSYWFYGFFPPLVAVLGVTTVVFIKMFMEKRKLSTKPLVNYYRSSNSFMDSCLTVTDWSTISPELRQFIYVLLRAYYSRKETNTSREVAFSAPNIQKDSIFFMALIVFFFVSAPTACIIGASFTIRGYLFDQYIGGIIMYSIAFAVLPYCVFYVRLFTTRGYVVSTNNLTVSYVFGFINGSISGRIQEIKTPGA